MRATVHRAVRAEPNVTPMIDVMLVLLIIFMVVAPALTAGFPAVPPRGVNLAPHPADPADQTLGIDPAGRYFLNGQPIARAALPGRLRAIFDGRTEDRVLFLTAHKDLDYREVLDILDVAARAGVRVVGMVAERAPGVPPPADPGPR